MPVHGSSHEGQKKRIRLIVIVDGRALSLGCCEHVFLVSLVKPGREFLQVHRGNVVVSHAVFVEHQTKRATDLTKCERLVDGAVSIAFDRGTSHGLSKKLEGGTFYDDQPSHA